MLELASAVGGGKLDTKLDLDALHSDIEAYEVDYDPQHYYGIILRFSEDGPAIIIYNSGSFSISGASSIEELFAAFDQFEHLLERLFKKKPDYVISFEVRNLVYVDEYDSGGTPLDLESIVIFLGLENGEYEPEQFPGVFYRPPECPGLFLIFGTGKLVLTGVSDQDTAEKAFIQLKHKLDELPRA